MKTFAFALLALACTASALSVDREFELFKIKHAKTYKTAAEHLLRKGIFEQNLNYIKSHNVEAALGKHTYTLAVNAFADMTHQEFLAQRTAPKKTVKPQVQIPRVDTSDLPAEVDWRVKGYVTPIKDQGQCGSCWAFSAVGAMEGQHFASTGDLVSMSEQNLVDCVHPVRNGCNGGLMDEGFDYVITNGINSEEAYPYHARDGSCKFDNNIVVASFSSYVDVASGSEEALQKATAEVGPISVAIDASHISFQFYNDGVYNPRTCSSTELDHGVLAVGYGVYENTDYWMVKNSWGDMWGMNGYIMMVRNADNMCGIATEASYPVV